MKVLEVTQSYDPFLDRGGPAVKVRALAHGLASRGDDVTVLTVDLGLERFANRDNEFVRENWGWRSQNNNVEAIYLKPSVRYRAVTWNPGVFNFCKERLPSFDVVHIYGIYDLLGPPVARACRHLGVPYVVEPIGMFRPIVRSIPLKRLYHRLLGNSLVRGAQRIVATSQQEQREIAEEGIPAAKMVLRRNGVERPVQLPAPDAFRRQWHIPGDSILILFLGRLTTKKSPDLLIEAFVQWRAAAMAKGAAAARRATLVIAGPDEGGNQRKLEALAAQLGVSAPVLFTGPLFDDAKWSAYRDADLFVLPSQNENFGNTAAEAIACETPVLVTDRCGIAPLIDGRAGLVVPHDRDALAAALGLLLDEPQLRDRLKRNSAAVAQSLGWEEPLDETQALYRELVRQRQSAK